MKFFSIGFVVFFFMVFENTAKMKTFEGNQVFLPSGLDIDSIVKIAAHVVPSQRQIDWQEMEMTAFVHFGLNTFYGREWGLPDYEAAMFDPDSLDVMQWAKVVSEAGAKMMIVLAKHHDGFCYWPSAFTDFSVKNSPWKEGDGDLLAEAAEACKAYGLKFGIYLSPWDIHSPLYGTDAYNDYFVNQLRELLTNYGEVFEVWFDGACGEGPNGKRQEYDWQRYFSLIRELAPNAVIAVMGPDVRWVGTESGYGRDTEWSVVPTSDNMLQQIAASSQQQDAGGVFIPPDEMYQEDLGSREKLKNAKGLIWYPSEVDVSIRPSWFYHEREDSLVKTPEKLVDIYFNSVGKNSMLLLNFSPNEHGLIVQTDINNVNAMRAFIDSTFKSNLAQGSVVKTSLMNDEYDVYDILDDDNASFWSPKEGMKTVTIDLDLDGEKEFNCALLQENFRNGQRIESFEIYADINCSWQLVASGTTIGYKRLLRFPKVNSDRVRLMITSARDCPEIATFGLYKTPLSY